jgi:hypothetical protein
VPIKILEVISPLILDIALPCLIFTNIIFRFDPSKFPNWWMLPLWWAAFTVITVVLSFLGMKLAKKEYKAEIGMSLLYPNIIFVPMVIIQKLFGSDSEILVELFLFSLFFPAFLFNTYFLFYRSKKTKKDKFTLGNFLNPILIATFLAITLRLSGLNQNVPEAFYSIAKILGNTALPLILLLIGGNVYVDFKRKGKMKLKPILTFVALKNFLFPFIILLLLILIKPPFSIAFLIFLISCVPPITAVPILVNKEGGNTSQSNQFVISSFIASIISIPLAFSAFQIFFEFN